MAFAQSVNPLRSSTLALQGLAFVCVLILFSQVDVRFGTLTFPFVSVPVIAVFIWPRGSDSAMSAFFVLIAGLLLDLLSGGITGLWAMFFLLTFIVIRPNRRSRETKMGSLWLGFAVWWCVLATIYFIIGGLSQTLSASWLSVLIEMVISIAMFPLVYAASQFARRFSADRSE